MNQSLSSIAKTYDRFDTELFLFHVFFPLVSVKNRANEIKTVVGMGLARYTVESAAWAVQRQLEIFLKNGLLFHRKRKGLQSAHHEVFPDFIALFLAQSGISHRIRDADCRNNTVGSNRHGNGNNRANVRYGNTDSINFFHHRCTASSTRSSGTDEKYGVHSIALQNRNKFLGKTLRIISGRAGTSC